MFKYLIILVSFCLLLVSAWFNTMNLALHFYILFPAALFPIFYFWDSEYRRTSLICAAVFIACYLIFTYRFDLPDILIFSFLIAGCCGAFWSYRRNWQKRLSLAERENQTAHEELDVLRAKHQSRLNSLHQLEVQVTSLLDLFEVARDFNEALSFSGLAEIVQKKVLPMLPCESFEIVCSRNISKENEAFSKFVIRGSGIEAFDEKSSDDIEIYRRLMSSGHFIQKDGAWFFLLLEDEQAQSHVKIMQARESDLAKFEVLTAYLALHVKKVNLYDTVRELSIRDSLTGVYVRRHFMQRFEEEIKRSVKYGHSLAVLMLDIDDFKRYNDAHGHLAGDATLKTVAAILRESVRKVDLVARFGGEEFVVALPESKHDGAWEVAERIRSNIARHHFKIYNDQTRVTVSIGGAFFPQDLSTTLLPSDKPEITQDLIRYADKALYRAKEEGRNRVVFFDEIK